MDAYWILEYVKVLAGYTFLMFLWPSVVFGEYLKGKSKRDIFSFCVTVQIVMINTVVLMLGLFGILHIRLVAILFYGIFLAAVLRKGWFQRLLAGKDKIKLQGIPKVKGEWILLMAVVGFGTLYFSYGSFQIHSYGVYDVFLHHGWVNKLAEGKIFPNGIYPEGMHCFIYCLYALFGIRIYSSMLYLQSIHIAVFFLSAYVLLREVFHWRYSPIFVLCLYAVLDIFGGHSMYRLPLTLPMEFGLHTQFLCGAYFARYMKKTGPEQGKRTDLFLFAMALAASIASHYYTTIMAFIVCVAFTFIYIKKLFRPACLLPLVISVFFGCMIGTIPILGGMIKGIPFQGSITWALNQPASSLASEEVQESTLENTEILRGPLDLTEEDWEVVDKLPDIGQKVAKGVIKTEYFIKEMYESGYQKTFEKERGVRIFQITVGMLIFAVLSRHKKFKFIGKANKEYFSIILLSFLSIFLCASCREKSWGFPVTIPEHRFCAEGFLMTYAVVMMPVDLLFFVASRFHYQYIWKAMSYILTAGIYVLVNYQENFHEFLFYSLNRYDAAAWVTDSIIKEFPKDSYTIVSPMEESFQVALYGSHEDIWEFLKKSEDEKYTLPKEHIFIYVEKKPIEYHQMYFFPGPEWLGLSKNSSIRATEISKEAAGEDLAEYIEPMWGPYAGGRTVLESKVYEYCQAFSEANPSVLNVYYEDEAFVCYYLKQDVDKPYNLAGE